METERCLPALYCELFVLAIDSIRVPPVGVEYLFCMLLLVVILVVNVYTPDKFTLVLGVVYV